VTAGTVLVVAVFEGEKTERARTTPVLRTTPPREGNFDRRDNSRESSPPSPLPSPPKGWRGFYTPPLTLTLSPQRVERVLYTPLHPSPLPPKMEWVLSLPLTRTLSQRARVREKRSVTKL